MGKIKECDKCGNEILKEEKHIQIRVDGTSVTICSVECMLDWAVELYDMADEEEYNKHLSEQTQVPEGSLWGREAEMIANQGTVSDDIEVTTTFNGAPIGTDRDFNPNQWVVVGRDNEVSWASDDASLPSAGQQRFQNPMLTGN